MNSSAHSGVADKTARAKEILRSCTFCQRLCKVNRVNAERGYCGLDDKVRCFREMLYPFEEKLINPSHQVYFAGCNLRCSFCTVAEWNAQPLAAPELDVEQMAIKVRRRKAAGAKTLNLLGGEPTVSLHGVLALLGAVDSDTTVVLNSNMYFSPEAGNLFDGLVDIYLADFKCGNNKCAQSILQADDYVETVGENILAAAHQADVIVRHLILPGHFDCCTKPVLQWLARQIPHVKVSLRGDYVPPSKRAIAPQQYLDKQDYEMVMSLARDLGLNLIQ
jgi:putative pyruvate formate lyase activating enzyme